jgi:outer membrane protein
LIRIVLIVLCALLAFGAGAASAATPVKIGFVNSKIILEKAPQAVAANKRLEKEFSSRKSALESKAREIQALEKKLAKDGVAMSESRRADLEHKILKKKRDLERAQDAFREDYTLRLNEELAKLQREVTRVIKEIAEQEKYDLILAENHVVFAGKRIDITDKILKRLSKSRR